MTKYREVRTLEHAIIFEEIGGSKTEYEIPYSSILYIQDTPQENGWWTTTVRFINGEMLILETQPE